MTRSRLLPILLLAAATPAACDGGTGNRSASRDRATATAGAANRAEAGIVDSVLPMDEAFRRFRAGLDRPAGLHSTITERDSLVARVVRALGAGDDDAFEAIALDRAEFAWLYYPDSPLARPPYELSPGIAWMQLVENDRKGVLRALREYGRRSLHYGGYRCDPVPERAGRNRLWTGCVVALARDGEPPRTLRLFGKIIEREGRFEIVSYANDF